MKEIGDYRIVNYNGESDKALYENAERDRHMQVVDALTYRIGELEADCAALWAQKDHAYAERDRLVALISKCFPAWLERHPDSDTTWEDDWRWIVFIELPTGQASWHIHDSELPWFDHCDRRDGNSWDGHTTEEKYQRVANVPDAWHYSISKPESLT